MINQFKGYVAKAAAQQVKASPALLKAFHVTSRDVADNYFQVFDSASGSTATLLYQWRVRAGVELIVGNDFFCGMGDHMAQGWSFVNGLVCGVSSTSGSFTPATDANFDFAVTFN